MIQAKWLIGGDGLDDAHMIRRRVFIEEQGIDEAVEMDGADGDAIHLVAYDGARPVATGRMRLIDNQAVIGRVAVLKEERGKGYGDFVARVLIWQAAEMRYDRQVVHAQLPVAGFYRKLGFSAVGEEYEEAGIPHITMVRVGGAESCGLSV
ncbi:MAG: GNAT family N-acetyltransferase [Defluviitaleaceae bacterium]|nr:GNAT family N-acetyltransferase [Defluviitaleaceae bacterium]